MTIIPNRRPRTTAANFVGIMLVSCGLMGCGRDTPSETPAQTPKPLPDTYVKLAELLRQDLKPSRSDFVEKSTEEMELGLNEALAELETLQAGKPTDDSRLNQTLNQTVTAVRGLRDCLREVRTLTPPSYDRYAVDSFLSALVFDLGGVSEAYQIEEDRAAAFRAVAERILDYGTDIESALKRLPSIALAYAPAGKELRLKTTLAADFDAAWKLKEENDWLTLKKGGPGLTNCTLRVTVFGAEEDASSVHFVRTWEAGEVLYARYDRGSGDEKRTVLASTVPSPRQIGVEMWCDQGVGNLTFAYDDAERAEDVGRACETLDVTAKYLPFDNGYLWDDQRGVRVTLQDGFDLGPCVINVAFYPKDTVEPVSTHSDLDGWIVGDSRTLRTAVGRLRSKPELRSCRNRVPRHVLSAPS